MLLSPRQPLGGKGNEEEKHEKWATGIIVQQSEEITTENEEKPVWGDEDDESTYGIPANYQPIQAADLGEGSREHIGKFIWRTNLKTDRFRLQLTTKEKKGIVINSVLCNITSLSDGEKYLANTQQQQQQ